MEIDNDPIELFSLYKNGHIIPIAFLWKGKKVKVEKVNLEYKEREGIYTNTFYSLSASNGTLYKISINGKNNICTLHEVEAN